MLLLTPTLQQWATEKSKNQLYKMSECSAWLPKEIQQLTSFSSSQKVVLVPLVKNKDKGDCV